MRISTETRSILAYQKSPICVDLDGTLVNTDLLLETIIEATRLKLIRIVRLFFWFLRGKAFAKRKLASVGVPDPASLPYNNKLISYLKVEHQNGRKIILATASDRKIAEPIAMYLGIFDDVLASDGNLNLKGLAKAKALVDRYGKNGFIYAGNSRADIAIWRQAKAAVLINTSKAVSRAAAELVPIELEVHDRKLIILGLIREIRPYQWIKNILIFTAPFLGNSLLKPEVIYQTFFTFIAFCATASGIYIINDLLDLKADRNHPKKRKRPFASGELPLEYGLAAPILILIGILVASSVSLDVMLMVILYIVISFEYSKYLKTKPLVDVFSLAGLYLIRIVAGGVASNSPASIWLLNFSGFLFLSLGFLKRYTEYLPSKKEGISIFDRRGYKRQDSLLIIIMGVGSSFISALVLGFYVESNSAQSAYHTPILLWGALPLILFWQCWMWLSTVRGNMHDDPIVYAAKDKISILIFVLILFIYMIARVDININISNYILY